MKTENKNLLVVFIMLVTIIVAGFAATIYYFETRYMHKVTGEETGLFAAAIADKTMGAAPLNVTFSPILFNFEGAPAYYWEFGDGNTSTEKNPKHNYATVGSYTCNLTVTDITGKIVKTSVSVLAMTSNLTINNPPTVVVLVTPSSSPRSDKPYGLTFLLKKLADPYRSNRQILYVKFLETLIQSSSSMLKYKSDIKCEAQVSDSEGDKIVWYKWQLRLPAVTKIDGTTEWPIFYFEGENLTAFTFPLVYVYRRGEYEIRVDVTDSKNNTRSDSKKFFVDISPFEGRKTKLLNKWKENWDFFNIQPGWKQNLLLKIWILFRPAHNISDSIVQKILSPLPPTLREQLYDIYYSLIWNPIEIKYHEPNWNVPDIPSNPYPANNSINVDLNADLNWTCSDPDGDRLIYDVYFGTTSTPPLLSLGQSDSDFELGALEPNTTYYWKIVAKDVNPTGGSKTTSGPIWSFTTQ